MNIESLVPFLLLLALFLTAFLIEALVLYLYKLKTFWTSFGISVVANLVSFLLIYYLVSVFLSRLGYDAAQFNGLNLQLPVVAFLWWFSAVAEGGVLCFFFPRQERKRVLLASILMNFLSFFFLYVFIANSH